jgi:hypothetical protein
LIFTIVFVFAGLANPAYYSTSDDDEFTTCFQDSHSMATHTADDLTLCTRRGIINDPKDKHASGRAERGGVVDKTPVMNLGAMDLGSEKPGFVGNTHFSLS